MKKSAGKRIAEREYPIDDHSLAESDAWALANRGPLARRIDRAIAAAKREEVRKERERWATELRSALMQRQWPKNVCDDIIKAINGGGK